MDLPIPSCYLNPEIKVEPEEAKRQELTPSKIRKPTNKINVDALRKEWCKKYCEVHGYGLFEISTSHNFNFSEEQEGKNGGQDGEIAE